MLADRQYMRQTGAPRDWSLAIVILVVNVLLFFIQFSNGHRSQSFFLEYGALSFEGIRRGFIWQFLTFQFLHGSLSHLIFNSIGLYFFGRPLEMLLGKATFIRLYLLSGVFGGVLQVLFALVFPRFSGPMVGASAGICGLVAAFAVLEPESLIYLFMVLPIRAKYFLPIIIGLPLLFMLSGEQNRIAHAAHLGGALAGIGYVHFFIRTGATLFDIERIRRLFTRPQLVKTRTVRRPFRQRHASRSSETFASEDFISKEVDPILDKISAHGIQSLTERERKILEAARARMAKR